SGPLQAEVMFRIIVLQPTTLQSVKPMRGKLKVGVLGMPLSGVRAQYFDAAGYLWNENHAGKPLINYRTELHAEFEYQPANDLEDFPVLLERRFAWAGNEGVSNPFREVTDTLKERGFTVDPALSNGGADRRQRWWATRVTDGREMVLDIEMERGERPNAILGTVGGDQRDRFAITDSPSRTFYTLTIRAYYPGPWDEVAQQMTWLEERLRQRLYLRRQRQ
ncbi:MAG: hypothetical protein H0T73_00975, partial [Ardenticatenales bacterium]|nr:hypothetical protein [Ardenticatenales bacterium]